MRYRIKENNNDSNSSQNEEFDSTIMNFLIRRINVEKRKLGGDFGDFEPLTTIEYTFNGFPGYGFNSYQARSYWTRQIIELLEEGGIIPENWFGDLGGKDPERQKIIRTVRKFIKTILTI
tara:strand:- start:1424 stop:1783 length:360 start_codon:yes stop_codon:yes gene_type:complete